MMRYLKYGYIVLFLFCFDRSRAQTGINTRTPGATAALDITSSTQGVLLPQYVLTDINGATSPVSNPATGSMIYNTGANPSTLPKGYYYWTGAIWERLIINNEVDQILKIGKAENVQTAATIIPTGTTTNNIITFDNTRIVNTIAGVTFAGGNTINLPAGTYRVDVSLDCYSPSPTTVATFWGGKGLNLYIINATLVNSTGVALTDTKVFSMIGSNDGPDFQTIQTYKFSYVMQLNALSTGVQLQLNHNDGSSDSSPVASANNSFVTTSGLVVTFYKFQQ